LFNFTSNGIQFIVDKRTNTKEDWGCGFKAGYIEQKRRI